MKSGHCCDTCGDDLCVGAVICDGCGEKCDPDITRGFTCERVMNRGDTVTIDYTIVDADGKAIDLTDPNVGVWFSVNPTLPKFGWPVLFQGTLLNGAIVALVPQAGMVRITMPGSATAFLGDGVEKLYYDVQIKDSIGRTATIEKGRFWVSPDVTRVT